MTSILEGLMPFIQPFLDTELVVELGEPIKSGKEATVIRCRAHPRTGHDALALEVYRSRLLVRDVDNVARFCDVPDAMEIAADIWARFERGEL